MEEEILDKLMNRSSSLYVPNNGPPLNQLLCIIYKCLDSSSNSKALRGSCEVVYESCNKILFERYNPGVYRV